MRVKCDNHGTTNTGGGLWLQRTRETQVSRFFFLSLSAECEKVKNFL